MRKLMLIAVGLLLILPVTALAQGYAEMPADAKILEFGVAGSPYADLEPGIRGGTMYISTFTNPKKWNDVTAHETSTTTYTNQMGRPLVNRNPITMALEPDLAKSWDVSADNLTITFHLRHGIKWSDGMDLTADDVIFTFNDLILNEDVETDQRDGLELPDGTFPVFEKVDDYTVKVTTSVVFRPIFDALGVNIWPKHKLAQYVHKLNPDVPAGTFNGVWGLGEEADLVGLGPFIVESYTPDQQIVMKRNPYYYYYDQNGTQLPYFDKYVTLIVASQDVELLKFRNGETYAWACRPSDVPLLKSEAAAKGFDVLIGAGVFGTLWISFNEDYGLGEGDSVKDQLRGLFRDVRFRKAVSHAMDKESIINNIYNGLAKPQWSFVSVNSPFYGGRDYYGGPVTEKNAVTYEYDLSKARALLDEIGIRDTNGDGWREFPDGSIVEFELNTNAGNTTREAFCLIMAEDLKKIGIKANTNFIDFNTLVTRLLGGTLYEAVVLGLTGGVEPHGGSNVQPSCGGLHFWHYSGCEEAYDSEVRMNELFDLGAGTLDNDEAFGYYLEAQKLDAEETLGMLYSVNQAFPFVAYDFVGNYGYANPYAHPLTYRGLGWDIIYMKG
jgi:peptide/nickel transport system substrate-binding protein